MKSSFLQNLGLAGITNYAFGKDPSELKGEEKTRLGTEWKDQTTTEKVITATTLPFRAVKRVVVAQKAISAGSVIGAVAGGIVGSYMGYMGWLFAGSILGGLVVGGLIGWGLKALFGGKSEKKDEAKAAADKPATVTTIDAATGTTIVSTPAPVAAPVAAPATTKAAA